MKKNEVEIGGVYRAKVTDKLVPVRIDAENPHGGWDATNLETKRKVRIKSAQRLRGEAAPPAERTGHAPPNRLTLEETKKLDAKRRQAKKNGQTPREAAGSPVSATCAKKTNEPTRTAKTDGKRTRAKQGEQKAKKISCLDAAAKVLAESGTPMNAKEMIDAMAEKKLWTSPGGKTPWATLYAAVAREITTKGERSRFKKADRGKFTLA